jgi:histone H3/H4
MTAKRIIRECNNKKDFYRVKNGLNKQECKDFMNDYQLVKNDKSDEVDEMWRKEATMIYELIKSLQSEDEDSKLLYSNIKMIKKDSNVKICDGFKHVISKVLKEVITYITHKCDIYTAHRPNRTLKSHDVECILRMLTSESQSDLDYLFKEE